MALSTQIVPSILSNRSSSHDDDCECDSCLYKDYLKHQLPAHEKLSKNETTPSVKPLTDENSSKRLRSFISSVSLSVGNSRSIISSKPKTEDPKVARKPSKELPLFKTPLKHQQRGRNQSGKQYQPILNGINFHRHKFRTLALLCWVDGCGEYLLDDNDLDKHLEVVHDIHPFRCSLKNCARSFYSKSGLLEHTGRFHDKLQIWPCSACSVYFKSGWVLYQHNFYQHHEGMFKCSKCDYLKKFRNEVIQHFEHVHIRKH